MTRENPWKRVDSKVVYKNAWITVREDQVIRPDGKPGIYGVVESRIATGVVAITERQEVVLVGQYRYPTEVYSWEIVEGGAEPGEPALDAAVRELKEEAGVEAKNWEQLGPEVHLSNCHSSEVGFIYLATELSFGEHSPEGTEVLQVRVVPIRECLEMVDKGEIVDALSIIALHRLRLKFQLF